MADSLGPGVIVVPFLSWHHRSFDTEPDITGWDGIPEVAPPPTLLSKADRACSRHMKC